MDHKFFCIFFFYIRLRFAKKSSSALEKFVFLTAASDNHFNETKVAIHNIRKHFPDKQVFFYDLGLMERAIAQVSCAIIMRYQLQWTLKCVV